MSNNLSVSRTTGTEYLNNFYQYETTVSSNQDTAVIAYFETITNNIESAKILASSVIYTSLSQNIDPMTVMDQMRQMDADSRNRFITMFLNFNRVGTSQLGINTGNKYNKYIERMIRPPQSSYADGSSPERAATNAKAILDLTGSAASGYYWIRGAGRPIQIYCDMTGNETNSTEGGWMRVDNQLTARYYQNGVKVDTFNYVNNPSPLGSFSVDITSTNGILRGIRWDLGTSIRFSGVKITRIHFNNIGGQDGYFSSDAPIPQWGDGKPTDDMVVGFVDNTYFLGNNFHCYGWSIGNGNVGSGNLVRLYKQASESLWPAQFAGLITLNSTAFYQYETTDLTNGRYIYYYESDGAAEYNNLIDYTIWLR